MGVVYRGHRLGLNRPVAVKFLHASFADDVKVRERFERELQAMSRLTHPNCVSVVDYGIADSPFIVMEYVTGPTLRHVLGERGRLSPVRALFIASQILAALAHAHAQDMVHRDIKPGNIILSDIEGSLDHVYVLDFGLAKFLSGAANDDLTSLGMLLGTPSYMSPEQARAQTTGAATDIYATGVVLFELLTGTKPYTGQTALDILHDHQFAPVPSIRERLPEGRFSPELDEAIQTAMAKDPAHRFASATAFARALDEVPEAASIRASSKLRAMTPPPGLDLGDALPASKAAGAMPNVGPNVAPKMPIIARAPETIAVQVETAATRAVAPQALAALAAQSARTGPPQAQSAPEAPAITSASTLSTLVPGGLHPRTTGPMRAAAASRAETPLAIAVGPLGRLGAGTTRIALVGAFVAITGLVTWLAARDSAPAQHAAEGGSEQLMRTALAVAGPAVTASEVPSAPGGAGVAAAVTAPGQPASGPGPAGAAAQVAVAPDVADVGDVTGAPAAGGVQVAEKPPASEQAPARAQPRPQDSARSVDSIDDIERLLQQGRRDEAMQGIIRLRRTNFTRSGYLAFQLGNLYFEKMQWSNGLAAYDDALRLKPEYRGNATLNANAIRALSHNQTWRKASALYTQRIRQAGVKHLREAAQSDRNSVVRQRAKQVLARIGGGRK